MKEAKVVFWRVFGVLLILVTAIPSIIFWAIMGQKRRDALDHWIRTELTKIRRQREEGDTRLYEIEWLSNKIYLD